MTERAMLSRLILPLLLTAGLCATATLARADERCTGTLCDLYYGGPPTDPSKPAPQAPAAPAPGAQAQLPPGATYLFAPRILSPRPTNADGTPAPADPSPSRVQVQGGGLIGLMNGTAPERCTGTICDLYYGGPPEEKPATPAAGARGATAVVDQEAAAPPPIDEVETVHRAPPTCAAKGRDPWSCYR